jgi:hypothetical protein
MSQTTLALVGGWTVAASTFADDVCGCGLVAMPLSAEDSADAS